MYTFSKAKTYTKKSRTIDLVYLQFFIIEFTIFIEKKIAKSKNGKVKFLKISNMLKTKIVDSKLA